MYQVQPLPQPDGTGQDEQRSDDASRDGHDLAGLSPTALMRGSSQP
jgi:hypothetical protein